MTTGILTKVEGILITLVQPRWEDVTSIYHAIRDTRRARVGTSDRDE